MGLVKTRRLAAMHPPSPAATEDREAAPREGGDEAAEGRRHAEGHVIPPAVLQSPSQGFLPAKPLVRKPVFVPTIARHVTYCNM